MLDGMSDSRPPVIDHNPRERRLGTGIWWAAWGVLFSLWALALYEGGIDWEDAVLGFGTGGVFIAWAIEYTGNRVPTSRARKPPRR